MPASSSLSLHPGAGTAPAGLAYWPRGRVSSLGSLESSNAHSYHGNVSSTRHSADSLLRSCSEDVRVGAHPESTEAAQVVGRRAPQPRQGVQRGKLRVMRESASGNELVCSKHQDFCRADGGLATGGRWGRRLACSLQVG